MRISNNQYLDLPRQPQQQRLRKPVHPVAPVEFHSQGEYLQKTDISQSQQNWRTVTQEQTTSAETSQQKIRAIATYAKNAHIVLDEPAAHLVDTYA